MRELGLDDKISNCVDVAALVVVPYGNEFTVVLRVTNRNADYGNQQT
jgi:hypothetical protein